MSETDWKELENRVKQIASLRWKVEARSEKLSGIDCDCVLRPTQDLMIVVEVTKNHTLDKIRSDIARLQIIRQAEFQKNNYVQAYIILNKEATTSMIETAKEFNITICSVEYFSSDFLRYNDYVNLRMLKSFGSAIDPITGENDKHTYIPVKYKASHHDYEIEDIYQQFINGKKILLTGDYGSGKSRCYKELFQAFVQKHPSFTYAFCINLRECWGLKTKYEIICRHLGELGCSYLSDAVMQVSDRADCFFLIDGFDEIGTQFWGKETENLKRMRREALQGVKELIQSAKGGIFISGREHYFSSSEEMLCCLGLNSASTLILTCPDEFTKEEMDKYIQNTSNQKYELPSWIPRKPLIYNIIVGMDKKELQDIMNNDTSYKKCWDTLISNICMREARIKTTLDGLIIKRIMEEVAALTRLKKDELAKITIDELNMIFHKVTGESPAQESAIILQRLPGLGKLATESPDRVFVDKFLLDGLRAQHLIRAVQEFNTDLGKQKWYHGLKKTGLDISCEDMFDCQLAGQDFYIKYLYRIKQYENNYLMADLVSILSMSDLVTDFKNTMLNDVEILHLNMQGLKKNLTINNCTIETIDLNDTNAEEVKINNSLVGKVFGIGSKEGLPSWINCNVDAFDTTTTTAGLRGNPQLLNGQKVLLALLHKIFRQRGQGRVEDALFRGFNGQEREYANKIIKLLINENIITKIDVRDQKIYAPLHDKRKRIDTILSQMTISKDSVWVKVTEMR